MAESERPPAPEAREQAHALFDNRAIERLLENKVSPDKVKGLLEAAAKYDMARSAAIRGQAESKTAAFLQIMKHEGEIEDRREARRFKSLLVLVALTVVVTASAVALLVMNIFVAGSVMVAFAGVGLGGCLVLAPGSPMEPKDVQKLAETMASVFAGVNDVVGAPPSLPASSKPSKLAAPES